MSPIEEIKQQIEEAKQLEKSQQEAIDQAQQQWKDAMDAQIKTSILILGLMAELREENQKAFDEDGVLLGIQV